MDDWEYHKERKRRKKMCKEALSKHYKTLTSEERRTVRTQLLLKQDGCCAICNIPEKDLKRKLSIDHCHTTGHIRGLLCGRCNTLLGFAKDSTYILKGAIDYLLTDREFI